MKSRKKKRRSNKKARVNLAPMVDITLSLLVMFVLSIPFIIESGIFVQRAAAGKAKRTVKVKQEQTKVIIYIDANDNLYLNEEKVTVDSLKKLLPELLKRSTTGRVVVSADSVVQYSKVIHLIDLSKQLGAKSVLILKRRSKKKA